MGQSNVSKMEVLLEETFGGSLQKLHPGICHFSSGIVGNPHCVALNVSHQAIKIISGIGNAYHADSGAVP